MRRSKRSIRRTRGEPENLSDVAAWLYTDLLLGLAVIFIGGGAFFVRILGPTESKGATIQKNPSYYLSCEEIEFQVPQGISGEALDIKASKTILRTAKLTGWEDPKAGLVQIFGIDPNLTTANKDATSFRNRSVSRADSLKNAELLVGGITDRRLNRNNVLVRIFVVFKGLESDNGCKNN